MTYTEIMNQNKLSAFILGCDLKRINNTVIIAPCWSPKSVGIVGADIISEGVYKVWDCKIKEQHFSFIMTGIGACNCADVVMALGNTSCKRILFMGYAGAIDDRICIGDIVFPQSFVVGEGASRYLQTRLEEDPFGTVYYINERLCSELVDYTEKHISILGGKCHSGKSISVESIFSQCAFIDYFVEMGCKYIDMESSAFVAATQKVGIEGVVCFCISDNILKNQSLYTVDETTANYRKKIRKTIIPLIMEKYINIIS